MLDTGSYSSRVSRVLRAGGLPLLAAALLTLAVLLPPMVAPVTAQESGVELLIVEGRQSDGSGGQFVSANSQTISEGLDVNYFIRLRDAAQRGCYRRTRQLLVRRRGEYRLRRSADLHSPELVTGAECAGIDLPRRRGRQQRRDHHAHREQATTPATTASLPSFTLDIVGTNSGCTASAAPANLQ